MKTELIDRLVSLVGREGVLTTPEDLAAFSFDGTFAEGTPGAVVLPRTTDQVSRVVRAAAEAHMPIIPRGMGTGLAAGSVSIPGGSLVLCLTRMNRVLEIDEANATAHVEAGVVTSDLQATVEKCGLFYPPDPSSNRHSTIGGNIACNAGGPRCLKYGVTGDYVLGLTVVLADGRTLRTGGKAIKDVTGLDLNALFTGSEGTLGVITEALLRLIPRPRFTRTAVAEFESLSDASESVSAILAAGIVPATLELMDQTAIRCVEEAFHLGLATDLEAMLILETDGSDEGAVVREIEAAAGLCREHAARSVRLARTEAEQKSLWEARRSVAPSLARRAPNKLGEDITVPRSAIPEIVRQLRGISRRHGLPIVIFGHAGDGNLHPNILFDRRQPEQRATMEKMVGEIFAASLALGGTLSGEHGIGLFKKPYLEQALGPVSMDVQRRIKQALDPEDLLNPGKLFA
jgi:glycolate oxidase